jgi:hypothetical protein
MLRWLFGAPKTGKTIVPSIIVNLPDPPAVLPIAQPPIIIPEQVRKATAPIPIQTSSDGHSPRKQHKRKRYSYEENHTASLGLFASTEDLEDIQNEPYSLLDISEENIIEHARRRVELFFYILVAYFQTGNIPEHGHVSMQFGRGRNSHLGVNITQACHSSLFGSLKDEGKAKNLLEGTHLSHSLNSTVELPAFVNKFDDAIENEYHCREEGLQIIKKVSSGSIDPIQGLTEFFKLMERAFDNIRNLNVMKKHHDPYLCKQSPEEPIMLKYRIVQLVEQGTFAKKWNKDKQIPEQAYIDMLLRIPNGESISVEERAAVYAAKMKELQGELLHVEEEKRVRMSI